MSPTGVRWQVAASLAAAVIALCGACSSGDDSTEVLGSTVTRPAPTTTTATGSVEGTVAVPDGWEHHRVSLQRADGTEVATAATEGTAPFAFEAAPGTYLLVSLLSSDAAASGDGTAVSAASASRTAPFEVGRGSVHRFDCDEGCDEG